MDTWLDTTVTTEVSPQGQTSKLAIEGGANLVIDGTERHRQRLQDITVQQEHLSGKKTHTDKNLVLVNLHSQKVMFLSATEVGKSHDKKQTDEACLVVEHILAGVKR